MTSGVWANSNYDAQEKGAEAPRIQLLAEIDRKFTDAFEEVMTGKKVGEIDPNDPFFSAMKVREIDQVRSKDEYLRKELGMEPADDG